MILNPMIALIVGLLCFTIIGFIAIELVKRNILLTKKMFFTILLIIGVIYLLTIFITSKI